MQRFVLASVVAAGMATAIAPGSAAPCDLELARIESVLQRVAAPERRQAIEALLEEAKHALMLHEADRCMTDVNKAKRALGIK